MNRAGAPRLPHGPEFRFVDRVLESQPGRRVVACLDPAELTQRPMHSGALPDAFLLEAMIQTCGLLLDVPGSDGEPPPVLMVAGLDRVRWHRSPGMRERIIMRSRIAERLGPFIRCRCTARLKDGTLLASGRVTLRTDPGRLSGPK